MDFKTLVERMHEASDSAGTPAEIVSACAKAALDLLGVPEGWPEGWVLDDTSAFGKDRIGSVEIDIIRGGGGYYATVESGAYKDPSGAMEAARKAVWAMAGRGAGREVAATQWAIECAEKAQAEVTLLRARLSAVDLFLDRTGSPAYTSRGEPLSTEARIDALVGRLKALESQCPSINREALARALHDAFGSGGRTVGDWGDRSEDTRQGYLAEADTAIRLCAGADAGTRIADLEQQIQRLQDRLTSAEAGRADFRKAYDEVSARAEDAIKDLERRNATLTATANAAVERAEKAEADLGRECLDANNRGRAWGQRLAASALHGMLGGKGYVINEMTDDLQEQMRALKNHLLKQDVDRHDAVARAMARADGAEATRAFMVAEVTRVRAERDAATAHAAQMQTDRREMIDHAERLLKRAEEAEVRAARAEKALRLSADAAEAATTDEEDVRQELYDTRAENDRLRRAIAAALRGAQHIATSAALLTGEADDA